MNRSELVKELAKRENMAVNKAGSMLDSLVNIAAETLQAGGTLTIAGFGKLLMRPRAGKRYTNPKTGEKSTLQPRAIPALKFSGKFKKRVE